MDDSAIFAVMSNQRTIWLGKQALRGKDCMNASEAFGFLLSQSTAIPCSLVRSSSQRDALHWKQMLFLSTSFGMENLVLLVAAL